MREHTQQKIAQQQAKQKELESNRTSLKRKREDAQLPQLRKDLEKKLKKAEKHGRRSRKEADEAYKLALVS